MCEVTRQGYKMNDGTLIPFHGIDVEHMRPEHIMELSQTPASTWDILLIKNAMHKQRSDIHNVVNKAINEYPGKKLKSVSGKAAQFNKIFIFFERASTFGIIIYLILRGG